MIRRRYPIARIGRRGKREMAARQSFREAVRARAGSYCEGRPAGICRGYQHFGSHAHHVVPRSRGGSHEVSNGLWVCAEAHHFIHTNIAVATALDLLRSEPRRISDNRAKGYWPEAR